MKILGLDSSGIVASVAIVEDENLIAEYTVNYKKTHSQTLLPLLHLISRSVRTSELPSALPQLPVCGLRSGRFQYKPGFFWHP